MRRAIKPVASRYSQLDRKASALLSVIAVSAIILISVSTLMSYSTAQRDSIERMKMRERETVIAESVIDAAIALSKYNGRFGSIGLGATFEAFHQEMLDLEMSSDMVPDGFLLVDFQVNPAGTPTPTVIDNPDSRWDGFAGTEVAYRITAQVRQVGGTANRLPHPGVRLGRTLLVTLVPIYQYAIFYEILLEFVPGPVMNVLGRVHANADMYLNKDNGNTNPLTLFDMVSTSGDFYSNATSPGDSRVFNASNGNYIRVATPDPDNPNEPSTPAPLYTDGHIIDSRLDEDWVPESFDRYGQFLRDQSHGVKDVTLPVPPGVDPHILVERYDAGAPTPLDDQKYHKISSISIIGNPTGTFTIKDANGNPLDPGDGTTVGPNGTANYKDAGGVTRTWLNTTRYIYDNREDKYVRFFEIDAARLREAVNLGRYPDFEDRGVMYVGANQPGGSNQVATRVVNATALPADQYNSFLLATDGPLYTKGDINTSGADTLSMMLGDSINVMSGAYNDSNNQSVNHSAQTGANFTTNTIFVGGIVPSTTYNVYSGGCENYFRYQELMGGRTHTFRGSILALWESRVGVGQWGQGNVYSAPNRNWEWDTDFQTTAPPPHFPSFLVFSTIGWDFETPVGG